MVSQIVTKGRLGYFVRRRCYSAPLVFGNFDQSDSG